MEYRSDVKYFIFGEQIREVSEKLILSALKSGQVYEVFKVKNSIAVFLYEHLNRLNKSLDIHGFKQMELGSIANKVNRLIEVNNRVDGNIKILIVLDSDNQQIPIMYYIPHHYPSAKQYKKGVKIRLQYDVRESPQAKVSNTDIRNRANRIIAKNNIYETLLVDNYNRITEGSRSSVFFIKGNELITSPDELVLLGITRQKVISIAESENISIRYEAICVDEIKNIDAAFLTNTSSGALQISEIKNYKLQVGNPIYIKIYNKINVDI